MSIWLQIALGVAILILAVPFLARLGWKAGRRATGMAHMFWILNGFLKIDPPPPPGTELKAEREDDEPKDPV